ncbi:MAG: hypothetical protein Q8S13_07070, partial [Dehalococcoidia bacterium]|nr:hypothetical protein [Dehalococcoidia bacterium]
ARSTIAQCRAAGAFPFMKQVGSRPFPEIRLRDRAGADPTEWPKDIQVREYPPHVTRVHAETASR